MYVCVVFWPQDAKDRLLGKLFGISALLRSGMRLDTATASSCITTLLDIASKRSYLRESATAAVIEAVGKVERTVLTKLLSGGPEGCEALAAVLAVAPKDATAEVSSRTGGGEIKCCFGTSGCLGVSLRNAY